jgi:hypothetical protein
MSWQEEGNRVHYFFGGTSLRAIRSKNWIARLNVRTAAAAAQG